MMLYVYILTHTHLFICDVISIQHVCEHTHTRTHTYKPVHESGTTRDILLRYSACQHCCCFHGLKP